MSARTPGLLRELYVRVSHFALVEVELLKRRTVFHQLRDAHAALSANAVLSEVQNGDPRRFQGLAKRLTITCGGVNYNRDSVCTMVCRTLTTWPESLLLRRSTNSSWVMPETPAASARATLCAHNTT